MTPPSGKPGSSPRSKSWSSTMHARSWLRSRAGSYSRIMLRPAGWARRRSDPDVVGGGPRPLRIAGIDHAARLDQQDPTLVGRGRLVLDAPGDHEHLPRPQVHRAITQLDPHAAVQHDEDLAGVGVAMPDELPLDLHELELIVVHLGHDLRGPVVGEPGELVLEADGLAHAHRSTLSIRSRRPRQQSPLRPPARPA